MSNNFSKINENFGVGSPIPEGYKAITELPIVFFTGLTGCGATTTLKYLNENRDYLILPPRREIIDKVIIPWSLKNQNKKIEKITNRKYRIELVRYFRKFYTSGIVEVLVQLSYSSEYNYKYAIFDTLKHVKEIKFCEKYFKNNRFVLFKANIIDRIMRISDKNYNNSDIGGSGIYEYIKNIPGVHHVLTQNDIDMINQLIETEKLSLEQANKAIQILIKEYQEYQHAPLAMQLYQRAFDRTLLIDSSALNPQKRAEEINNWLISESTNHEKN